MVMEFDVAWWVRGSSDEAFRTEEQCHSILADGVVCWSHGYRGHCVPGRRGGKDRLKAHESVLSSCFSAL